MDNLKNVLAGFKTILSDLMDTKIADIKVDTTALMDKATYVANSDTSAVNKSIYANTAGEVNGLNTAPIFSVYGIDQDGNKGFYSFPVSSAQGDTFSRNLLNVTAGTIYSIPLADEREYYDLICQAYEFVQSDQNVLSLLKTFDNTQNTNFDYSDDGISFTNGMQIKKEYPLSISTNSDNLFESEVITKSDYLAFSGII
jgi:hypothetical protein